MFRSQLLYKRYKLYFYKFLMWSKLSEKKFVYFLFPPFVLIVHNFFLLLYHIHCEISIKVTISLKGSDMFQSLIFKCQNTLKTKSILFFMLVKSAKLFTITLCWSKNDCFKSFLTSFHCTFIWLYSYSRQTPGVIIFPKSKT